MVDGCTEVKAKPKPPWKERKEAYLQHLRSASFDIKLIAAADKVHNAESLVCDWHQVGPAVWKRFTAGRDQQLWFYRSVLSALGYETHPLMKRLSRAVEAMEHLP
jgi:(p)ppGpp synthase/HD superfamily hydrolase